MELRSIFPEFYEDTKPKQVFFGIFENAFRIYLEKEMVITFNIKIFITNR